MSEAEKLEERLKNWGRYIRTPRPPKTTTCTAFDLHTEAVNPDEPPEDYLPPINIKDALLVMEAWRKMYGHHEELRARKHLIAEVYANPGHSFDFYRSALFAIHHIRVRLRDIEPILNAAKKDLQQILSRLDKRDCTA